MSVTTITVGLLVNWLHYAIAGELVALCKTGLPEKQVYKEILC